MARGAEGAAVGARGADIVGRGAAGTFIRCIDGADGTDGADGWIERVGA